MQKLAHASGTRLRKRSRNRNSRSSTYRVWFEPLEDRFAPATYVWTGANSGIDTNWADAANWSPNSGFPNAIGDIAQFTNNGATTTATVDTNITVGEIDFDGTNSYTINSSGGSLTFQASVGNATLNVSGTATGNNVISAPITLNSSLTVTHNAPTSGLTISGLIAGLGTSVNLGSGSTGTLTLTNNGNTYNGGTSLTSGTLSIPTNAVGSGAITFTGGTLNVTGNTTLGNSIALTNTGSFNINSGATLTESGVVTGSGGLVMGLGTGTLALTGNNNLYSGAITANAGKIVAGSANALGIGSVTENGGTVSLQGSRSIGFEFFGQFRDVGTLATTDSTGVVPQANWNVAPNTTSQNQSGSAANLIDSQGATTSANVSWSDPDSYHRSSGTGAFQKLMDGFIKPGTGSVSMLLSSIPYARYDLYVYFNSDGVNGGGAQWSITDGTSTYFGEINNNLTTFIQDTSTINGAYTSANYVKFTGETASALTLICNAQNGTNPGITGIQIVSTTPAVTVNANSTLDVSGVSAASVGALTISNGATLSVTGSSTGTGAAYGLFTGPVTLSSSATISVANNVTGSGTLNPGAISGGSNALTKAGAGTLMLPLANSFSGGMTVSAGSVLAGNALAFGGGRLTLSGGTVSAAAGTFATGSMIGVRFQGTDTVSMTASTPMAGVVPMSNWNNETASTQATPIGLNDNTGASSGATATWTSSGNTNSQIGDGTSDIQLMDGLLFSNPNTPITVTLAGIPYANYSIYAYFADSTANHQIAATLSSPLGSSTYYYTTWAGSGSAATAFPTNYTQATNSTAGTFPNANYAIYSGLTGSSQTLTLQGGANNFSGLTAIQIVPSANVVVAANSTLDVTGVPSLAVGTLSVSNGATLSVTGSSTGNTTPYSLTTGAVTLSSSATINIANNSNAAGTMIVGAISDGGAGSSLTKGGAGTLILTGAGTYSGATSVTAGILQANTNNAISAASQVNIAGGATFNLNNFNDTIAGLSMTGSAAVTNGGTLTLAAGGSVTYTAAGATTGTIAAGLNLNGQTVTFNVGQGGNSTTSADLSISGVISNGSLSKNGAGDLLLSSANTYAGGSSANGGILQLTNAAGAGTGNVSINTGGTFLYFNGTAGTVANPLTLAGGTLASSGADQTYSGTVTVATGPSTIQLFSPLNTQPDRGVNLSGVLTGSGMINLTANASNMALANYKRLLLSNTSTASGFTGTVNVGQNAVLTAQSNGTNDSLGTGSVVLTAGPLNTGTIQATTLELKSDVNATFANNVTVTGTGFVRVDVNNLTGATNKTLILSGTLSTGLPGQTLALSGANNYNLNVTGPTVLTGNATFDPNINTGNDNLTLNSITDNSAGYSLTMAGSSILVLNGTSSYSGGTTISSGTLQIGTGGTTGTLGTGNIVDNGVLTFNLSTTTTVAGAISGTGSMVQAGTGTTILAANNSYSGTTTISAGTLQIGTGGTTGSLGPGNVVDNSVLVFNRSDNITVANVISGTGSVVKPTSDTLTLSGANSYSGGTAVNAGTIIVGNANGLGTGTITQSGGLVSWQAAAPGFLAYYYTVQKLGHNPPTDNDINSIANIDANIATLTTQDLRATGGASFAGTNDFSTANFTNGDPNFNNTAQNFVIYFEGIFNAPTAGTYTFFTKSDDGSDMFVDGSMVVNNLGGHAQQTATGSVNLTAGPHSIVIGYYQLGGGYFLEAGVTAPGGSQQDLPFTTTGLGVYNTFANNMVVNSPASLDVTGIGGAMIGTATINGSSWNVTSSTGGNTPYIVVGGNMTFSAGLSLNVANNGTGSGTVYLGSLTGGTNSLTLTGPGTLNLSAAASTWSGNISISAGTLVAGNPTALGSGSVTAQNGTVLQVAITTISNNINLRNGATLAAMAGNTVLNGIVNVDTTAGDAAVTIQTPPGSTLSLSTSSANVFTGGSLASTVTITGTGTFSTANSANNSLDQNFVGNWIINNGATLKGIGAGTTVSGTLYYLPFGQLGNGITINGGGTLSIQKNTVAASYPYNITMPDGTTSATINIQNNNTQNGNTISFSQLIIGTQTLNVNDISNAGYKLGFTGSVTATGSSTFNYTASLVLPNLTLNSATNQAVTFNAVDPTTSSAIISGAVTEAGGGLLTLTKNGTNTLTLGGVNSYSGGTNLNAGTVAVSADNNLGNAAGALTFAGGTLGVTSGFATSRSLVLNTGGGTFNVAAGQTFTDSASVTGAGSLTMASGTGTMVLASASNSYTGTILNAGTLSVAQVSALGGGNITFGGGTLFIASSGTLSKTVTFTGAGTFNIPTGTIITVSAALTGAGSMTLVGGGTLVLTAANTNTGSLTIASGTVQDGILNALVPSTTIVLGSATGNTAGVFDLNGFNQTTSGNISTAGTSSGNMITNTSATAATLFVTNTGAQTWSFAVNGNLALTKFGSGALILTAVDTYSGATVINAGTLTFRDAATALNSPSFTVNQGAGLVLDNSGANNLGNRINNTASMTLNGAELKFISASNTASSETVGTLTLASGANTITMVPTGTGTTSLTISGGLVQQNNATALFRGPGLGLTGSRIFSGTGTISGMKGGGGGIGTNNQNIVPWAVGDVSTTGGGTDFVTYDNTRGLRILGLTTGEYANLSGAATGVNVKWTSGSFSSNTMNSLIIASGANAGSTGGTAILESGAILLAASPSGTSTGTFTFQGGASGNVPIYATVTAANLNAIGTAGLQNYSTSAGLVKTGAGTLTPNTTESSLSGGVTLNVGSLNVTGSGIIPSGNTITFSGGTLAVTAGNPTISNAVTLNANGGTFNITGSQTLTLSGIVSGPGGFANVGAGTLVLANTADSYQTAPTVSAGVLLVSADSQFGPAGAPITLGGGSVGALTSLSTNRSVVLTAGGGFNVPANTFFLVYGTVSGTGNLTISGAGTTYLANTGNSFGGSGFGVSLSSGTLMIGGDSALGNSANTVTFAGGTLAVASSTTTNRTMSTGPINVNVAGGVTYTIANPITGANLALNKFGLGMLVLAPSASDTGFGTGAWTINAGIVQAASQNAIGGLTSGGIVVGNGATLQLPGGVSTPATLPITLRGAGFNNIGALDSSGGSNTISGTVSATVATIAADAGTLLLSGTTSGMLNGSALTIKGSAGTVTISQALTSSTAVGTSLTVAMGNSGVVVLGARGNYTGGTYIASGTLKGPLPVPANATQSANLILGDGASSTNATYDLNGSAQTLSALLSSGPAAYTVTNTGAVAGLTLTPFGVSTYSGVIAGGANLSLTKIGTGTLFLTGSNSYSGGSNINSGAVNIQNSNALGSGGTVTVASGAALQLQLQGNNTLPTLGLNLSGTGSSPLFTGALENISGNNTWVGATALANSATIQSDAGSLSLLGTVTAGGSQSGLVQGAGNVTFGSIQMNTGSLTMSGTGTLAITGADTSTHSMVVNSGTLILTGSGRLAPASGQTVSITVNGGPTPATPAALVLDDSGGTAGSNRLGGGSFGTVNVTLAGGTLKLLGGATTTSESLGAVTLNPGFSTINVTPGANQSATLTAASLTQSTGSSVLFSGSNLGAAPGSNVSDIVFTTAPTTTSANINNPSAGIIAYAVGTDSAAAVSPGFVTYDVNGVRLLTAAEYTTSTPSAGNNFLVTSSQNIGSSVQLGSLLIGPGGSVTVSSGQTLTVSSILTTGSGASITGGTLALPSDGYLATQGNSLNIATTVSGAVNLVKSGPNTLTLSATSNTIGGGKAVYLNGGTVSVNADGQLGVSTNTLAMNGGTLALAGGISTARTISIAASGTGTVNVASGTATLTGTISGASSSSGFVVTGGGTVQLNTAIENMNGGTVTVNQGTLTLNATDQFGSSGASFIVNAGATLSAPSSPAQHIASLTLNGNATVSFGSATQPTFIANAIITYNPVAGVGGATITQSGFSIVTNSVLFNIGRGTSSADLTISAALQYNSPTITKTGAGILKFTGSNQNGVAAVNMLAGTLQYGVANVFSGGSSNGISITLNSGATWDLNGFSEGASMANLTFNGGGTITNSSSLSLNQSPVNVNYNAGLTAATIANVGSIAWSSTTLSMNIARGTAAVDLSISGVLAGSQPINKTGQGILGLSGANTMSGNVFVQGGTLQIGTSSAGVTSSGFVSGPVGTGTLTLNNGAILQDDGSVRSLANAVTWGTPVVILNSGGSGNGGITFDNSAGKQLTFNSTTVQMTVNNRSTITQNLAPSATATQSAVVSLTKYGTGTLALQGGSNYTGGTILAGGTLQLNTSSAVSGGAITTGPIGTGVITLIDGTKLQADSSARTLQNAVLGFGVNSGSGTTGVTLSALSNGNLTIDPSAGSVVVLTAPTSLTVTNAITISEAILGPAALTKAGSGPTSTLALTSANSTYTGGTTLTGGTLLVGNSSTVSAGVIASGPLGTGALTLNTAGTTLRDDGSARKLANAVSIAGVNFITIAGSGSLNFDPTGLTTPTTVTLTGSPILAVTNTTTISEAIGESGAGFGITKNGVGTLALAGVSANTYSGVLTVNLGEVDLGKSSAGTNAVGAGGIDVESGTLKNLQTEQIANAALAVVNGGVWDLNGNNETVVALAGGAGSETVTSISGTGTLTLSGGSGVYSGVLTTNLSLIKAGIGFQTLAGTGANTYTGTTTVIGGDLALSKTPGVDAIPSSGVTVAGGTLRNVGANQINDAASVAVNSGTWELGGSNETVASLTSSTTSGTVTSSTASSVLNLTGSAVVTTTYSGLIAGAGNLALTKAGTGTQVLSGVVANTYTGTTTVSGGELDLNGSAANGTIAGTSVVVTGGVLKNLAADQINDAATMTVNGGAWDLGGKNETVAGLASATNSGTITNSTATLSILTLSGSGSTSYAGVLTSNLALVEAGPGTQTLSGANGYTGSTTISGGTLRNGASNALPITTSLIDNGSGTFDLNGFNQTVGSLNGGGVVTNSSTSTPSTFTVNDSGTDIFSGTISDSVGGPLSLVKSGSGTLVLSGINSYAGGSTLNGGTTVINSTASLGATSGAATINTAVLEVTASFATSRSFNLGGAPSTIQVDGGQQYTINGTIVNSTVSGALNKTGTGTLILTNSNSYSGGTTVSTGTLLADNTSGSATGTGGVFISSSGTLGGTGTVSGNITASGTVSPGNSPGTLSVGGGVTFNSGSTYKVEINGTSAGQYDQLDVTGPITINSSSTLQVVLGYNSVITDTFIALNNVGGSPITGTFQGLPEGAIFAVTGPDTLVRAYQITYQGNGNNNIDLTQVKAPVTSTLTSSPNPALEQANTVTFTASVTSLYTYGGAPSAGSTVTFLDNGSSLGTATLDTTDQATFTTSTLTAGHVHTMTVTYGGDSNFAAFPVSPAGTLLQTVKQETTVTVFTSAPNPTTFGQTVTFTATVSSTNNTGVTPGGTVTFEEGASVLGVGTLDSNGTATFNTNSLAVGSHTVQALYSGDAVSESAAAATSVQTVTVASTATTVSSSTNPSGFGQPVTFTATVSNTTVGSTLTPTGSVQFVIDGTNAGSPVTVSGSGTTGLATFTTNTLTIANSPHTVVAVYTNSDGNFTGSTGTLTGGQAVTAATTATTVVSSLNPSAFGRNVTFTATVSNTSTGSTAVPTGSVQFAIDGTNVGAALTLDTAGRATFTTNTLTVNGTPHSITATYSPSDSNFTAGPAGTLTGGQTITAATTATAVASSSNPSGFGQTVTFTATVSNTSAGSTAVPTGTVQFSIDGTSAGSPVTLDGAGKATYTTSTLPLAGSPHTITVAYTNSDGNFTPGADGTLSGGQMVTAATTAVTVAASPSATTAFGQNVTFTATVSNTTPNSSAIPTGSVQFKIDGTNAGAAVTLDSNGIATYTTNTITVSGSPHTITAVYSNSDGNFTSGSTGTLTGGQTVTAATTAVALAVSPSASSVYGQTVTFTATVSNTTVGSSASPAGNVQFKIDGTNAGTPVSLSSGTATFNINTIVVSGSPHTITAVFSDSAGNFAGSTGTLTGGQTVTAAGTSTAVAASVSSSVYGQSVSFTATVSNTTAGSTLTPVGNVQFVVDGNNFGGPVSLSGGTATFTTTTLAVTGSPHSITAVYSDAAGNFATSTGTLTGGQTVTAASTALAVTATPASGTSVYGQTVTFTATVSNTSGTGATPTGTVQFAIDGTNAGAAVTLNSSGVATFATSTLTVNGSPHTITATYSNSDGNFTGGETGTLTGGQTVTAANTSTTVSSSTNPSGFGQSVTFTATVSNISGTGAAPTGTVQFVIDGTDAGSPVTLDTAGKATYTTTTLVVAQHTVTAVYSNSDNNFTPGAVNTITQTVTAASTTTTVTSPSNPVAFGVGVTFTATVTSVSSITPTGSVQFVIDGTSFGSPVTLDGAGHATATSAATLTVGSHSITATYTSDTSNFNSPTTGTLIQSVTEGTTTALSVDSNPSSLGQTVTFTAIVSAVDTGAGAPTGTVTFADGGTSIGQAPFSSNTSTSSTATFSTSTLTGASHSITAVYNGGSSGFLTSTSNVVTQSVTKADSATAMGLASNNHTTFGTTVTFTATVSSSFAGTLTGTVTFLDVSSPIGTVSISGSSSGVVALLNIATLSRGSHQIRAAYSGDANYNSSNSFSGFNPNYFVDNAASTTTALNGPALTSAVYGQVVSFTATITNTSTGVAPAGPVTFLDGGTVLGTVGTGTISGNADAYTFTTATLALGGHTITASYNGDDPNPSTTNFASSASANSVIATVTAANTATVLTSSANPSAAGQTVTFTATVTAISSTATPTGTVDFFDTTTATDLGMVTLAGGVATLSTSSLTVTGSHTITATYTSNSANFNGGSSATLTQSVTASAAATSTTVSASATSMLFGQTVTFTATVTSTSAPTGTVTFLDGALSIGQGALTGSTATSSTATFSTTSLAVGSHTITAIYTSNNVNSFTGSTSSNAVVETVVNALFVTSFTPTSTGFQITFNQAIDVGGPVGTDGTVSNIVLNLYDSTLGGGTLGPADLTITGTSTNLDTITHQPLPLRGSVLVDQNNTRITFIVTGQTVAGTPVVTQGILPNDTYTVTLLSKGVNNVSDIYAHFRDSTATFFLDGTAGTTAGDNGTPSGVNYTHSFAVSNASPGVLVASLGDFARGPTQPVNLPDNTSATGIPIKLLNTGASPTTVTSVKVNLTYNPALLTINSGTVGNTTVTTSLHTYTLGGSTYTYGLAFIDYEPASPVTLNASAALTFVQLTATVPSGAPYGDKEILHFGDVDGITGAPTTTGGVTVSSSTNATVLGDDAIHAAAYMGDVFRNGPYSAADPLRVSRVIVHLDSGFRNYPLLDPVVIGNTDGSEVFSAADPTAISREIIHFYTTNSLPDPFPPQATFTPVQGGPDPVLSIPTDFAAKPQATVQVPVEFTHPDGLDAVDLAIAYDTSRLTISAADIQRGDLLRSFNSFTANVDQAAGIIYVTAYRTAGPLDASAVGSSLALLNFHVKADAPAGGAIINLLANSGGTWTLPGGTDARGNDYYYLLEPKLSNAAGDVLDGRINVLPAPVSFVPQESSEGESHADELNAGSHVSTFGSHVAPAGTQHSSLSTAHPESADTAVRLSVASDTEDGTIPMMQVVAAVSAAQSIEAALAPVIAALGARHALPAPNSVDVAVRTQAATTDSYDKSALRDTYWSASHGLQPTFSENPQTKWDNALEEVHQGSASLDEFFSEYPGSVGDGMPESSEELYEGPESVEW